jgi:hypothetical protein
MRSLGLLLMLATSVAVAQPNPQPNAPVNAVTMFAPANDLTTSAPASALTTAEANGQTKLRPGMPKFAWVETAAHVSLAAYDIAQTCAHLGPRWHEDFLPSQHCAPIAGMVGGQVLLEEVIAHKLSPRHPRLAQTLRLLSISDTMVALTYSWTHR